MSCMHSWYIPTPPKYYACISIKIAWSRQRLNAGGGGGIPFFVSSSYNVLISLSRRPVIKRNEILKISS